MAGKGAKPILLGSHFFWGRSAWTLLFAWVALSAYAAWRLLATALCLCQGGASCGLAFSSISSRL